MASYTPSEPMKKLVSNEEAAAQNPAETGLSSMFSSICKPAFAKRLTEIISEKQATVFSTTYCPYCTKAKKLLDKNQVSYNEIMLDEISGTDQMEVANCIYGDDRRFVPYVYYNKEKVGGYGELFNLDKEGKLTPTQ